jgi:hypothetical protein
MAAALVTLPAGSTTAGSRFAGFDQAGLDGDGGPALQAITAPARLGRIAAVPGSSSGEAWAIGRSQSVRPGWAADPQGQVVFLHWKDGAWHMTGPPTQGGRAIDPALSDLAVAPNGEGWAVGDGGVILHHKADTESWTADAASGRVTTALLQSVSVVNGAAWAVGKPDSSTTILSYTSDSGWRRDPATTQMTADGSPGLIGVAAVSADEAWAVSDETVSGVKLYHFARGSWQKVTTGQQVFDGPFPAVSPGRGSVNQDARGASIAADADGAWVGGSMRPTDAVSLANGAPGDTTRPFVLHVSSGGGVTSYCPDRYEVRTTTAEGTAPDITPICDKPFPTVPFDIPSISVAGGRVLAGGLGLFSFQNGAWVHQPDPEGYVLSVSMSTPNEGWTTSGGGTYFRGDEVRAVSPLVGHWTTHPLKAHVARWPESQRQPLEAVAVSPDGNRALAVGQDTAAVAYDPKLGWDITPVVGDLRHFHAAAWPDDGAWAVGDHGIIDRYDGSNWKADPASSVATVRDLFGVAFRSSGDGMAVGSSGVVLRWDGARWSVDQPGSALTANTLYAVTATSTGYVVAGGQGTVLELSDGAWRAHGEVPALATVGAQAPADLYAATTMGDGRVVVGGQRSVVLAAPAGGSFASYDPPLAGTVLALGASGGTRLVASVTEDVRKYDGTSPVAERGAVLASDGFTWSDLSLARRATAQPGTDTSSFDDPVYGLAFSGTAGWAAGGTPAGVQDAEGHLRSLPTGSVYRVDPAGDPTPPATSADVQLPSGVNFAVFGESWCGTGLCGSLSGSGTQADTVALRIRDEINRAAKLPNGPRFVLFLGNMRSTGLPEELAEFHRYLQGFDIPVYSALGDRDLFTGADGSSAVNRTASSETWRDTFGDMPGPWGTGETPVDIQPVASTTSRAAGAATHYAFDVVRGGQPELRVIVIDSSTKSLGDASTQNPPEQQSTWFDTVATDAQVQKIPMVVAMNQPTVLPDNVQYPNWTTQAVDQQTFETSAATHGVTAVFAGGARMNTTDSLPARTGVVPLYIMGGGGAPLGADTTTGLVPTKQPGDGYYDAWHAVSIDTRLEDRNILDQAAVRLHSFPALDSLAMHALDGGYAAAGDTLRFSGLARELPGGWSDLDQAMTTYMDMGAAGLEPCRSPGQGGSVCQSINAIRPPYRFYSEDPSIADFVVPDFGRGGRTPALSPPVGGKIVTDADGTFGLLCTFKAGTVGIDLESGFFRKRFVITIGAGAGPCVQHPVLVRAPLAAPVPAPPPVPAAAVPHVPAPAPPLLSGTFTPPIDSLVVVLPPPPAPIVAPAPPASAAGAKKEEEEHQTESAGQDGSDGEAEFTAIRHSAQRRHEVPLLGWWLAMTMVALGVMGGTVAAGVAVRRRERVWAPQHAPQEVAW